MCIAPAVKVAQIAIEKTLGRSKFDDGAFYRDNRARPRLARLSSDSIHGRVVVIGIVVEHAKCLDARFICQPQPVAPGGMSPPALDVISSCEGAS